MRVANSKAERLALKLPLDSKLCYASSLSQVIRRAMQSIVLVFLSFDKRRVAFLDKHWLARRAWRVLINLPFKQRSLIFFYESLYE